MKPICVKCQRFYRPKRNAVRFIEAMPNSNDAPSGTQAPEQWSPYKLWCGDLWECNGCGHQLISSVAFEPLGEHYQGDFAAKVERASPIVTINDC